MNLVHSGAADLLHDLVGGTLHLTPTILDPDEASQPPMIWAAREPTSEFLRPLHPAAIAEAQAARGGPVSDLAYYRRITPHIVDFASRRGESWLPLDPTPSELRRANRLASRTVRQEVRARCPDLKGRVQLNAGEAEAVAVAAARELTLLVDDQAAVNLVACLHANEVRMERTCGLLKRAAEEGLRPCVAVADLFNRVIRDELRFYAQRQGQTLTLLCDPPRCEWR